MSRSDISGDATDDLYDNSVWISIIMMASPTEIPTFSALLALCEVKSLIAGGFS